MKKSILFTVAFLIVGFANAQDKKEMSFGVKGGLNVCSVTNVTSVGVTSSTLIGYHVGGFGEFFITDKFALQPELLYSAQGVKVVVDGENGDMKFDYFNIPVMAKYYVTDALSLELGPQIGLLLSAKAKLGTETTDVKDSMNSTDYGVNFGGGYNIGEHIVVGIRYYFGLGQLQKSLAINESASANSVFHLSFGYKF